MSKQSRFHLVAVRDVDIHAPGRSIRVRTCASHRIKGAVVQMSHVRWLAVCVVMAAVASAACVAHSVGPATYVSPPLTAPIASNLPSGVCVPTYNEVGDVNAIRIEAKLVTRETLLTTDPDFPPTLRPGTEYFWVVAKTGQFTINGPMPPGGNPPTLREVVILLQASADPADRGSPADLCNLVSLTGGESPVWPAWFDKMTAIADVKIR